MDDPNTPASCIHQMIKLGLTIDEDVLTDDAEDVPALEEADEGSRME